MLIWLGVLCSDVGDWVVVMVILLRKVVFGVDGVFFFLFFCVMVGVMIMSIVRRVLKRGVFSVFVLRVGV